MTLAITWAADMLHAINDLPTAVTIGGTAYNCIVEEIQRSDDVAIEGVYNDYALAIHARLTDIGTAPEPGTLVTIGAVVYRVDSVVTQPDGVAVKIVCSEKAR